MESCPFAAGMLAPAHPALPGTFLPCHSPGTGLFCLLKSGCLMQAVSERIANMALNKKINGARSPL